ncbi:rolling circle replication-associated protein [Rheinheimera sp.]|uniref:rolling circle replication-associated protein n=6 Tax=Pseudomonadota TaxID=1224 RepID=UPI00404894F2
MACFHPLTGFRGPGGKLVHSRSQSTTHTTMTVPCGQCIGCRLDRSKMWAARCIHEASLHPQNCFITLTYDDDHLPEGGTLVTQHFQKFMKRLRKRCGAGIRFYHCGEYGDQGGRPHYHALIFNYDFPDKKLWKKNKDYPLYTSELLQSLWTFGFSTIGALTYDTAAYTARYIMKKINGPKQKEHYQRTNPQTGEINQIKPEYITMSRRPGIGTGWFKKYQKELWPDDFIVIKHHEHKMPRFYDRLFEVENPKQMEVIKKARRNRAKKHEKNNTPERLAVRKKVLIGRTATLTRTQIE